MGDTYMPTNQEAVNTYRMFTGFASQALGVTPDQNYASEDGYMVNPVGQHAVYDPYRGSVVQGTSNVIKDNSAGMPEPGLNLIVWAALAWGVLHMLKKA